MNEKPSVRQDVIRMFSEALRAQGVAVSETPPDDMPLLKSGMDSLGFARLVTRLEMELGYDPFILSDEPLYPRTLGDFIAAYEKFASHRV